MALTARKLRDPASIELQPLVEDPRYAKVAEEIALIDKRMEKAQRRLAIARARARGQRPTTSDAQQAAALLAGGKIANFSALTEIDSAQEELAILDRARLVKAEELQRVRSEISFEACKRFADLNVQNLRAALEAATALHRALEGQRVILARLVGAGYDLNFNGLPATGFFAAAAVGDPERAGTPAAGFREWLVGQGLV